MQPELCLPLPRGQAGAGKEGWGRRRPAEARHQGFTSSNHRAAAAAVPKFDADPGAAEAPLGPLPLVICRPLFFIKLDKSRLPAPLLSYFEGKIIGGIE